MKSRFFLTQLFAALLLAQTPWALADDDADMKALRAAKCEDLMSEYRGTVTAEKDIRSKMKAESRSTTAGNVAGLAMLATLGVGFFSWHDTSDAEELLEEVHEYQDDLKLVMREKNCPGAPR